MSTVADAVGLGALLLLAALIILCIIVISLFRSLRFVYSSHAGRSDRAQQMIRLAAKRVFVSVGVLALFGYSWSYWGEARLRSLITPGDCQSEQSPDRRYKADYCYLGEKIVLRLFNAAGQQLLAERTYRDTSDVPVSLYWSGGAVSYADGDDLRAIQLPPSFIDRLRAKLP